MNDEEALVLITKAGLIDPRMKRNDPIEKADMADAWAVVLRDVDIDAAIDAMHWFYRSSSGPIMPADIVTAVGQAPDPSRSIPSTTEARLARELEAAGLTAAEIEAHADDEEWLRAHLAPSAIEEAEPWA